MDDLYDNLENYNDVNIVSELKCENKELKLKLEEYSKAMVQLQKDFDKLSSEYKKLEMNYSSLLKTARAEIQRKTEMINTLNLEKDTIIVKTLKNKGKRVFNAAKSQMYAKGLTEKDESTETVINKDKQNSEAPVESKIQKDNRVDSHQTPSVDSISSISKENKSGSEERVSKPFDSREKNKNKENLPRGHHKNSIVQSNENETNRRFTTPVNSYYEATFSSDEDSELKNSDNFRKSPLRNEVQYYERQDNRDYRTEFYEHYESLNEPSRRRSSKYLHSERFKNADKYESHSRHRRHHSPERNQHRYSKEYTEYTEHYPPRGDYGRHRLTRSPPSDKYNRSKSRDRRFAYDRENYRDHDKHSTRFYEHASGKHKIRNELDEPSCKRQKTDTYNKHIEEKNCYLNEKEREFAEQRRHVPKPQESDFQEYSSCQSPDYIVIDSTDPEHSVKEIMGTAATKLEDPRVSSKRYILSVPNNTLSTVVGQNIDLKMVDKSVWGIKKIDVPAALTNRIPEQESDILLKDIYMNIENPSLHDSLESGKIQSYDHDDLSTLYSRKIDKDDANETNNKHQNTDSGTRILTDLKEKVIDKKVSEKPLSNKFKIPKIKKPDKDVPKLQVKQMCDKSDINLPDLRDLNDDIEKHQPRSEHNINTDDFDKLILENELAKNIVIQNSEQTDSDKRKEIMKTIEGDLELSDEASDVELHKDTNQTWRKSGSDKVQNIEKDLTISPSFQENNSATTIPHSAKISSKKRDKTKSLTISGSTKDSSKESRKKRKRKRKSSEQNEIKESHDAKKPKERECKPGKKKEKDSLSKETLNKFSDLFGDSSSLITPDDLGISNVPAQSAEKYSSIFENTQDAVDLSGEVVISKLSSTNKSDTIDTFNSAFNTVVEKVCDENTANNNNFSVNVTVVNGNVDNNAETKNVNSNNTYENAKSEMPVNENSIVKTVVISSGTQNECVNENSIVKTVVLSSGTQNECVNENSIVKTVVISSGTQNECVNENSIVKTVVLSSGTQNECVNENSIVKTVVISSGTQNECVNENSIVKTVVISSGTQNECVNENSIVKTMVTSSGTQNECVNENSIVKTVVISSGTQNECVSESLSKDFSRTNVESVTTNVDDVALKKCPLNISKALAISTPQKYGDTVAPIKEIYEPSKFSNTSNINDNIEQNEADIPDVRIFVRRRRKPVKKLT